MSCRSMALIISKSGNQKHYQRHLDSVDCILVQALQGTGL
jgi:hypothetical protein